MRTGSRRREFSILVNILCAARVIDGMKPSLSSRCPSLQRPSSPPDEGIDGTSSPQRSPGSWRMAVGILLVAMALVAAACSGTSSSASSSTSPSSTPPTSGRTSADLAMATKGTVGAVLVSSNGHTLYHLTTDTAGSSTCTGSCAQLWPPMTVPSGTMPTAVSGLSGTLGTITRSDGTTQVTYNGEPLYWYSPDTTAGDP